MDKTAKNYCAYLQVLKEELVPAMGCTEPIAIAFAAAKAKEVLGEVPDRVEVQASGNIIKNVKSVVVPNTGGLKGIDAATAAGIVAGAATRELEVISKVSASQREQIDKFLESTQIKVSALASKLIFDLVVTLFKDDASALVRISQHHTHIVRIEKNGTVIFCDEDEGQGNDPSQGLTDRSFMTVEGIVDFSRSVDIGDVEQILQPQIDCNMKIAREGLAGNWGANIGSVLLDDNDADIVTRAKAMAAAASDARMGGCSLPVVIVSGSGNQGITASVPVIEYAAHLKSSREALFRALVVSNLVTIHQKTGIGRLSAYCGAVSAGVGAGAGIAFLHGGGFEEIAHTIVNSVATVSGIICDGAKPSCAAKIAISVGAGILGFRMYRKGQQFYGGDGIVTKGVENTITNVGRLGRDGMSETDKEIIRIMLGDLE